MSTRAGSRPKLAPGDFVFLSFLAWAPMTAYDVKKFMAQSVSNFWTAAHSQVYQQARRLARDGYLREQPVPGARRKRLLHLTPKGRRAVRTWLRQPARPPQYFSEAMVKVFFARQAGDLDATLRLLEHEREGYREQLAAFEALLPLLEMEPDQHYPAMTLDLGMRLYRTLVGWCDETIRKLERERARSGNGAGG